MAKLLLATIIVFIFASLGFSQNQDNNLQEADKLNAEAADLYRKGQFDSVINVQLQELALRVKISGADDKKVGGIHYNLAVLYRKKNKFDEAAAHFEKALVIYRKHFGENDAKVFELTKTLAEVILLKNDKKQALVTLSTALRIGEKIYGAESSQLGELNVSLGNLNAAAGDFDMADKHYIRAIEINDNTAVAAKSTENGFRQDVGSYICFLSKAYEPGKALKKIKELEFMRQSKAKSGGTIVQTRMFNYLIDDLASAENPDYLPKLKMDGLVAAFVTIDETGRLHMMNDSVCGPNFFIERAIKVLRESKFKPAITYFTIYFNFYFTESLFF